MTAQIITTEKKLDLKGYFYNKAVKKRFEEVLGSKAQSFIISVLSLASTSNLEMCDPATVINAAMTAATLDLPINQNLGFAYIIPYKDKAQFQLGYKGFIQLAMRSGQFKTLNVSKVCEGEIETQNLLTGEITFQWKQENREKLPAIGFVAYMRLINGFEKSIYMTTQELKNHGLKYSSNYKKYGTGMWSDNFDAMAKKTVIKQLLSRYAPLTPQMQVAQLADQAIINGENEYEYIDNKPLNAEEVAEEKEKLRVLKFIQGAKTMQDLEVASQALNPEDIELMQLFEAKQKELEAKEKLP